MTVMANDPLVSICIPTYNAEATFESTLASILAQTYRKLRIVIVDNASVDGTLEIARRFDDPRIEVHSNTTNVGAEGNFNRCIQLASGKYAAIYHADDLYEPDIVAREVEFLETHPEAGAVFTGAWMIDNHGAVIKKYLLPSRFRSQEPGRCFDFRAIFSGILRYSNFVLTPSVMVRTDIYQNEICRWRGDLFGSSADLDVWLRILRPHQFGICSAPLMRYRVSAQQGSQHLIRQRLAKADLLRVLERYVAEQEEADALTSEDRFYYSCLQRTDRVVRAMNHLMLGNPSEAVNLTGDVSSRESLAAAFSGIRGLQTLLLGAFVRASAAWGMGSPARRVLKWSRKKLWK